MKFQLVNGSILDASVDAIAIPVSGDPAKDSLVKAADSWLDGAIADVTSAEQFKGRAGQVAVIPTREAIKARFVILVGSGAKRDMSPDAVRNHGSSRHSGREPTQCFIACPCRSSFRQAHSWRCPAPR